MNPVAPESKAHLAAIVRASHAAIIGVDRDRRIQSWNAGAETLFGYCAEESVGADFLLIVPEERRAEALAERERANAGESFTVDTFRRHKSGRLIGVALSLAPIREHRGAITGTCTVAQTSGQETLERAKLEAAEGERRRIGQELHDHLCQHLLGAAFAAKAVALKCEPDSPARAEIEEIARLINDSIGQVRAIVRGFAPPE